MDLNKLLYHHQVSLMRAEATGCGDHRDAQLRIARDYALEVENLQERLGAAARLDVR